MPWLFLDAFQTGAFHLAMKNLYFSWKNCIKIALLPCLCRNCLVARLHLPPLRGTPRNDRTSAGSLRERRIAAAFSSAHYLNESPMNCCLDLARFSNREVNQRKQDKVHPTKTLIKSMIMKMMLTVSGGRDGLVSRWLSWAKAPKNAHARQPPTASFVKLRILIVMVIIVVISKKMENLR